MRTSGPRAIVLGWLITTIAAQVPPSVPTEIERSLDQVQREREEQRRLEERLQERRRRLQQENQRREEECLQRGGYMVYGVCRR